MKIYMVFDTIVEKVISELSDQVAGILKGQQLQAYMTGKLEEIQASFIKCCGAESYFHDLDADMERKAFWDNLLRRFFSISKGESTELYVKGFCEGFLEGHKQYSPYGKRIETELLNLSNRLKEAVAGCKYLNGESRLIYFLCDWMDETKEQLVQLQEVEKGTKQEVQELHRLLQTYIEGKSGCGAGTPQNGKLSVQYQELISIKDNSGMSAMEKEWNFWKWAEKTGDFKEAAIWVADNCRRTGERERALFLFKRIADGNKEEYQLYNDVGCLLNEMERHGEALDAFCNVLKVDENNIDALYNMSTTFYDLGDGEQSYCYIQRAYQLWGEDADVANFYGLQLMIRGRDFLPEAERVMGAALKKHPADFFLRLNYGTALMAGKKFDAAISVFQKLYEEYPEDVIVVGSLGLVYGMLGVERAEEAVCMFQKAYEISGETGYLRNVECMKRGRFLDSFLFNGIPYPVYSDEELLEMQRMKSNLV